MMNSQGGYPTSTSDLHMHGHVCIYAHTNRDTPTYEHAYTHTHIPIYEHAHTHHIHTCEHEYTTHIHANVSTHPLTHVNEYTWMHTICTLSLIGVNKQTMQPNMGTYTYTPYTHAHTYEHEYTQTYHMHIFTHVNIHPCTSTYEHAHIHVWTFTHHITTHMQKKNHSPDQFAPDLAFVHCE